MDIWLKDFLKLSDEERNKLKDYDILIMANYEDTKMLIENKNGIRDVIKKYLDKIFLIEIEMENLSEYVIRNILEKLVLLNFIMIDLKNHLRR